MKNSDDGIQGKCNLLGNNLLHFGKDSRILFSLLVAGLGVCISACRNSEDSGVEDQKHAQKAKPVVVPDADAKSTQNNKSAGVEKELASKVTPALSSDGRLDESAAEAEGGSAGNARSDASNADAASSAASGRQANNTAAAGEDNDSASPLNLLILPVTIPSSFVPLASAQSYTGVECGQSPVLERASVCGVEVYAHAATAACGEVPNTLRHSSCGVEKYVTAPHVSCGAKTYKQVTSMSCPGSSVGAVYEVNTSRYGSAACTRGGVEISRTTVAGDGRNRVTIVTCKLPDYEATCNATPLQATSYNSCQAPQNGVELYNSCQVFAGFNSCRSSAHPVELYNQCETRKENKTCEVLFKDKPVENWVSSAKLEAGRAVAAFAENAGYILALQGKRVELKCMTKSLLNYQDSVNPGLLASESISKFLQWEKSLNEIAASSELACQSLQVTEIVACDGGDFSRMCNAKKEAFDASKRLSLLINQLQKAAQDAIVKSKGAEAESIKKLQGDLQNFVEVLNLTVRLP